MPALMPALALVAAPSAERVQGLREGGNLPSGFELCVTCKYKMHETEWEDQIQPRLGVNYRFGGPAGY